MEKYLSVLNCPVSGEGEDETSTSSRALCPSLGITPGLSTRHLRVRDGQLLCICIWESQAACDAFFNADWHARAEALWEDGYDLRVSACNAASAA
ncbi:hypothetical protein [Methylobacterium sp. ID0610]|uniref:hypothetical protein n=1 Tax=Methylobacterium carpenticola TaxID=3344827 RepID=UPI0036B1FB66